MPPRSCENACSACCIDSRVRRELIVELRDGADAAAVEKWLRQHGLEVLPLTVGLLASGEELKGAANIGIRPTFDPPKELLEPYFFDFAGDLYGQEIEVAFRHFLRPEAKFASLEALQEQMARDCEQARKVLAQNISSARA